MRQKTGATWAEDLPFYAVLLTILAVFFLTYFNRFAALRSGNGEYTAGMAFLSGRLPYRDYYTTAPPFNLLKSALLLKLFGTALIVTRYAAVVERLLIAAVLFRWLRQIFRPIPALIASVVTVILSAGDRTDPLASYNHDAILLAMICALLASLSLDRGRSAKSLLFLRLCSGCSGALSVLAKQTVGVAATLTVFAVVAVLLWTQRNRRAVGAWMITFLFGCLGPIVAVALYLHRIDLLRPCLSMLFVQGPAAKAGHAWDFFVRDGQVAWDNFGWLTLGSFVLALAWKAIGRAAAGKRDLTLNDVPEMAVDQGRVQGTYVLLAGLGVIGLCEWMRGLPALHDFTKSAVYFTLFALTGLLANFARHPSRGSGERPGQWILFASVSWSVAASLSLSWPAFEAMLLPGLGLLIAAVLEGSSRRSMPWVYAALGFVTVMQVREKLDLPFGFDYQDEAAVRWADSHSMQTRLRGMRLPPQTVRFLDEAVATIQANTTKDEPIFVYPEMGILYALSDRNYPTFSGSHNIDVLRDSFAAQEAERLRSARPRVILFYRETEQQQRDAERLWRNGKHSGQRILAREVEELIQEYRLAGTYQLAPGDPPISIFVAPNSPKR